MFFESISLSHPGGWGWGIKKEGSKTATNNPVLLKQAVESVHSTVLTLEDV